MCSCILTKISIVKRITFIAQWKLVSLFRCVRLYPNFLAIQPSFDVREAFLSPISAPNYALQLAASSRHELWSATEASAAQVHVSA